MQPFLSTKAYIHVDIYSHNVCYTTWSHATKSTVKPIRSLFKKTWNILDRNPFRLHNCNILILDLDSHCLHMDIVLVLWF